MASWEGRSNGSPFTASGKAVDCRPPGLQKGGVIVKRSVQFTPLERVKVCLDKMFALTGGRPLFSKQWKVTLEKDEATKVKTLVVRKGEEQVSGNPLTCLKALQSAMVRSQVSLKHWWQKERHTDQMGTVEVLSPKEQKDANKAAHKERDASFKAAFENGRTTSFEVWFTLSLSFLQALQDTPLPDALSSVPQEGGRVIGPKEMDELQLLRPADPSAFNRPRVLPIGEGAIRLKTAERIAGGKQFPPTDFSLYARKTK